MRLKELDLHVTNRCNLKCKICCYSSNEKILYEMTTEQIIKIISEAKSLGCEELHISGGEPLLRDDILDICEYAINENIEVRIQTNGTFLDAELALKLRSIGLRQIMISLDGSHKGIMDSIRGVDSFDNAVKGIQYSIKAGLDTRVNTVITQNNKNNILEIIKLAINMGVSKFSCFYFSPIGRGKNNMDLWLNPDEYIEFWNDISDKIGRINIKNMDIIVEKAYATNQEAEKINTNKFTGCGGGCSHMLEKRDYLIIRCDGYVFPCILMIDFEALGNVTTNSVEVIWKDSPKWNILKRPVSLCDDCKYISVCNAGCAGYAFIMEQKINIVDPRCKRGDIIPLCPIMKYNFLTGKLGGSSVDVMTNQHEK